MQLSPCRSQMVLILHFVALLAKRLFTPDITSLDLYLCAAIVKIMALPFFGHACEFENINFWQEDRRDFIFIPKWPQLNSE